MTSIIILTYNSENHIENLVKSIYKHNINQDFEVIIADNNSSDKTIQKIGKLGKKVRLIINKKNLGFAAGINTATQAAKGEFLLFINPDSEWTSGAINDLKQVFIRNEMIGIVGGKLLTREGKVEKSAGRFLGILESATTAFGLDEALGVRIAPKKIKKVDFVSGGFMMVKKNVFNRLGGFDENLFMYFEDMEFCFRAKNAGVLTYYTPEVTLTHESHGSSSREFAIKNIYRGIQYFQHKHKSPVSQFVVKSLFVTKAIALVLIGKMLNNKYLTDTYTEVLKA